VSLNIRHPGEKFVLRGENEWPLARTRWTKYFLQPQGLALETAEPAAAATLGYETTGDGLSFRTPPLATRLEITGLVAAKLWLSSETADADLFLALRLFDPAGTEVTFIGSNDRRPLSPRRSGGSSRRDFRLPEYRALCRRQAALPLVADNTGPGA